MIKKIGKFLLIAVISLFFTGLQGCDFDEEMMADVLFSFNKTANDYPYYTSADKTNHDSIGFIMDTHADTMNFHAYTDSSYSRILGPKNIFGVRVANSNGHVDLVRMIKGNVALEVFALIDGGSADAIIEDSTFETDIWDDNLGDYIEDVSLTRGSHMRHASNFSYDGPSTEKTHAEYWGTTIPTLPRPPLQYNLASLSYPCQFWFDKKAGEDWPDYIHDWPFYVIEELEYINFEQRCRPYDEDPNHDYIVEWIKGFADNMVNAATLSQSETNKLRLVRSKAEFNSLISERQNNKKVAGAMMSIEGIYINNVLNQPDVDARAEDIFKLLYNKGFRMASLTHFEDNEFGGSSTGMGDLSEGVPYGPYNPLDPEGLLWDHLPRGKKIGISKAGRKFIELMMEHGMIIDIAHSSPELISAITDMALAEALSSGKEIPVINSHGGLQGGGWKDGERLVFTDNKRNLSDSQIREIVETGGVIGIGLCEKFVGGDQPSDVAKAIRYVVDLIDGDIDMDGDGIPEGPLYLHGDPNKDKLSGVEHVSVGSDYDGGITVTLNIDKWAALTRALTCEYHWFWRPNCLEDNFTLDEVSKILGENMENVMESSLPDNTYVIP